MYSEHEHKQEEARPVRVPMVCALLERRPTREELENASRFSDVFVLDAGFGSESQPCLAICPERESHPLRAYARAFVRKDPRAAHFVADLMRSVCRDRQAVAFRDRVPRPDVFSMKTFAGSGSGSGSGGGGEARRADAAISYLKKACRSCSAVGAINLPGSETAAAISATA